MSQASETMRREWAENDAKRDAGLTTPEDIERFDNLQYGPDPVWNLLDVYRPKNLKGKIPVIINVHGGGWVYGDKELYQFYGMSLAQRGFAVVNFTYRLAPEVKFPAPLEDTNNVVAWMYKNQEKYGLDMEQVFMVGDSAGGHLCGLYCAICTNPEYAANYDFKVPDSFVPVAVGLNCGAYAPLGGADVLGSEQDSQLMEDFLPEGGSPKERALINAADHVNSHFPPTYLMTCVGDFCRSQAPLMEKALKKNGVYYEFVTYGSEEEPLYHVFHVAIKEPMGQKCNDDECGFFRRMMH
ncbi:MAG: alpha/beta hydrolase [Lachnospiraceae bacterium]|nr:alpha/beta hydrolase [Lachnospiraceae bacterium]